MTKKQNWLLVPNETVLIISLLLVIIVCFFLFVPKVASTLFPWKRDMILQNFLQTSTKSQDILPQTFWEFREFYSPGYYTFNRTGLSQTQIQNIENRIGIFLTQPQNDNVFLLFTSPHLISLEALVSQNTLQNIVKTDVRFTSLLVNKNNEVIESDGQGNTYIVFVKPLSDMEKANGFFDYTGVDKDLVAGKYWLDITKLDGK